MKVARAALHDASTGALVAEAASGGLDFGAMLDHARDVGGPALAIDDVSRACRDAARARQAPVRVQGRVLRAFPSHRCDEGDSWIDIDGGIGTMLVFASKGARELPNSRVYLDGAVEPLSKGGTFVGQHICVPLEGAAVHINAFNFPGLGHAREAGAGAARRRARDRQARDLDLLPDGARGPAHRRDGTAACRARCNSSAAASATCSITSTARTPSRSRVRRRPRRSSARTRPSCAIRSASSRRRTRSIPRSSGPTRARNRRSSTSSSRKSRAR